MKATQRDAENGQRPKHVENKRHIRTVIHAQLKRLWEEAPALTNPQPVSIRVTESSPPGPLRLARDLAQRHSHFGFHFVPLVTEELNLICALDILFLRPEKPGSVIWAGDIDNRLKTLLDALRIPEVVEGYSQLTPSENEDPFFVLLEDDKLISSVSVETDRILEPISGDSSDSRLIITVRIRPQSLSLHNLSLG